MKFVKSYLSVIIIFFSISMAQGQEWIRMQQDGKSFEEIKAVMADNFSDKSTLKSSANYSRAYKKYARWEYFWRFQTDENGAFVNQERVWKAWNEAQEGNKGDALKMATANWSYLGPDTIPTATAAAYAGMGRLNAVAFDPSNNNTIWVGAANGGLWKSINGGSTWASAGGNIPVLGISDIVISSDGNTMYVASGDADGQHSTSVGVLKSTDGGATFTATGLTNSATTDATAMFQVQHLWLDPTNSNTVVATTTNNIQKTTNGGTTWTEVDGFSASDLIQDPNNASILYAGSENYVLKSTDKGDSWDEGQNPVIPGAQKIELAMSAANSNIIYAFGDDGQGAKSTNAGASWSSMNMPQNFNTQGGYNMAMAVAPNNASKVIIGGINGWSSTNGGSTWTENLNGVWEQTGDPGKYVHSDHHMMRYQPGSNTIIFSAHDGGIHKGDFHNLSATWTDLSAGLFITQFYGMDGFPGDDGIIIAGAQDNDGAFLNGGEWKNINNNSDGIDGAINYTNSNISFCQSQQGSLFRTLDGWENNQYVSPQPQNQNDEADFVWPIEMDPTTPTTLYVGYGNIYKTTNNGNTWTSVTGHTANFFAYSSISVSPANAAVIYAVRGNEDISRSNNGGSTWANLTAPAGVGSARITDIEASLTDAATVYITYGNYTAGSKVFKSSDSGATWTNISTGIPNMPTFSIVEKAGTGDLYLGTQLGVYELESGATTWTAFNTNLPPVSIRDFHIHETSNTLRAASFGRGIWQTSLSASTGCPSAAVHIWTGATSTAWNVGSNWNTGCVPTSATVIEIPDVTNDPIIASTITGTGSAITIKAGGLLTVQSGGTFNMSAKNISVDQTGILAIDSGGILCTP